jgi:glucose-6-phosphate-specific signal transduction histidine kinase
VVVVVYWVLFLVLQRVAALLAPTPAVSVWYFPAALSLALLLILGPAYAPALLVAPFLGNLLLVLRPGGIPLADAVVNALATLWATGWWPWPSPGPASPLGCATCPM